MVDAGTDTILTPSWWDSDIVTEAKAATTRKRARKPVDSTKQQGLVTETEDDTGMDTEAFVNGADAVNRIRRTRKTVKTKPTFPTLEDSAEAPFTLVKRSNKRTVATRPKRRSLGRQPSL